MGSDATEGLRPSRDHRSGGFDPWPVRLLPCSAWTVRCAGRAL